MDKRDIEYSDHTAERVRTLNDPGRTVKTKEMQAVSIALGLLPLLRRSACKVHRPVWSNKIMSPRTKKNLMAAIECDAIDAAKYARCAALARKDDDWELAQAFQETADNDRTKHFPKEAELEGLIASSPDNLRNAIDSETKELKMFREFAHQANEDGDLRIASLFEEISRDKAERCARFEAVLADMGLHSNPQTLTA